MATHLIYHPAFDPYHCAYRTLLLATKINKDTVEVERLRIWDFYFVFPQEVKKISFPRDLWSLRSGIDNNPNPYEELIDSRRIFERMKPFQLTAFKYLAAYGFIEPEQLANNIIKRTEKSIPRELLGNMERLTDQQKYVIQLISSPLNDLTLYGIRGLKDRTKLLDFKYDAT